MAAVTGGTFHLAVRTVADVLDVPRSNAGRLLKAAVAAGELEVVEPGVPDPRRRIASTYRLGPRALRKSAASDLPGVQTFTPIDPPDEADPPVVSHRDDAA